VAHKDCACVDTKILAHMHLTMCILQHLHKTQVTPKEVKAKSAAADPKAAKTSQKTLDKTP